MIREASNKKLWNSNLRISELMESGKTSKGKEIVVSGTTVNLILHKGLLLEKSESYQEAGVILGDGQGQVSLKEKQKQRNKHDILS